MEAQMNGIKMHFEKIGEGRPILILHGGYLDHRHMIDDMEPLFEGRDGWMRIYPDLPGHGRTEAPDWISTYDQILDVVQEFIDHLFHGQRFVVAGMSAGGHVVRGLIKKRGDLIDGAFFSASVIEPDHAKRKLPECKTILETPEFAGQIGADIDLVRQFEPIRNGKLADWWLRNAAPAIKDADVRFARHTWEPENYTFSFDVEVLSKPFPGPTLFLCGRQDAVVGYCDAWATLKNFPRATYAVLDASGHLISRAHTTLFESLVTDWLNRVEQYAPC